MDVDYLWSPERDGVQTHACNCVGPQNGNPVCPCQMPGYVAREAERRKAAMWDIFTKGSKPRIRIKAGRQ